MVSKILRLGPMPVSLFAGVPYWADRLANGPDGVGLRFGITLLFPR